MARVKVPAESGEITISIAGGEPVTYKPARGYVDVPDADAVRFVAAVPGSEITAGSNPEPSAKE